MQNVLKRFGEKGTDSFNQMFKKTRVVLTLVYVVILVVLLVSSAGISRSIFSQRLHTRFESLDHTEEFTKRRPPAPAMKNIQSDFQETILFVNGFLLIVAGLLSYGLAGLTLRPIKDSYHRQRQFLSDASHELRTPLAILQTDLENQLAKATSQEHKKELESHLEEIGRMTHLVNDLLKLSQMDEKGLSLSPTVSHVSELVGNVVDRLRTLARNHHIEMHFTNNLTSPLCIFGDVALLGQALTNVIKNAIVYNKQKGEVYIKLKQEKNDVIILIQDTGIGMESNDVAHAFERFYRTERSRSRQSGGSGLGLSIALAIIQTHKGKVRIESQPNKGTLVTILLPIHSSS